MISTGKLSLLQCPTCTGDLSQQETYLVCANCATQFPIVNDIVIFLTKEVLFNFLNETWGNELQKENKSYHDNTFVSNEVTLENLQTISNEATREGKTNRWFMTGTFPEDTSLSEENRTAIAISRDRIIEFSMVSSATRILDWPTGHGYCLSHLVTRIDPQALVVALDVNLRSLSRIKPFYENQGFADNMLFVVADARNMPFRDGVFQSVTAWGGTCEIENAEVGFKESFRVLEHSGWFGISGDQYKEDSPSMKVAEKIGLNSLLTKNKLEKAMIDIGFKNPEYEVLFEGYDLEDELTDEKRCPLPARGDWFQLIAAAGQKL